MTIKDFSRPAKVIQFTIDEDTFTVVPRLPAQTLIDFTLRVEKMGDEPTSEQGIEAMIDTLKMVLLPDSYKIFHDRMKDPLRPIELVQANQIIEWVMGEYGMRPTKSPEALSTVQPSPASGTNSTEISQGVA